jgi:Trp operon repressor
MKYQENSELAKLLVSVTNIQDMQNALELILTESEFAELNVRVQILTELCAKTPQREIAKKLKVGIATVTRGSNALKNTNNKSWWTSHLWR